MPSLEQQPRDRDHRQPAVVPLDGLAALKLLLSDAIQELCAEAEVEGANAICPWLYEHFVRANKSNELDPTLDW
eukprot:CAMPEP_0185910772 /NCGR_PEP_ID=MMETSP0196C-20130402/21610_1 /TAXON_ID=2932 /ORGANISM="Alexandrium fundyense, Strain CCMP1719" /LENGTH=73 /DNA_ID=CAMNT_0028631605 /DNA_START=77 /DNA_END=294 /DNA_ORIENTATION=-